jgi:hypothetical protein
MTVYAVLNDTSLQAGADPVDVVALLEKLEGSFTALQHAVAMYDRDRVRVCLPDIYELKLPDGTKLPEALRQLEARSRDTAKRLRSFITKSLSFNEQGMLLSEDAAPNAEVTYQGVMRPGLLVAWTYRGICCSADRPAWRTLRLTVEVTDAAKGQRHEHLPNLWSGELDVIHRKVLQAHVEALPIYENPGHHDPQRPQYDAGKSQIPEKAERLLRHAVKHEHDGTTAWWTRCEHGFYHRFQGPLRNNWPVVHWNGTTNPNAMGNRGKGQDFTESKVPPAVRARLALLERVSDCGCREV